MQTSIGIEGDYLETKHDHLIFDIKGIIHPKDRKICFIRFYPHPEGDRVRDGIQFKKIYDLDERYSFLRQFYPKYLFYSKNYGLELQSVQNQDILSIYHPRNYFKALYQKNNSSELELSSKNLCELFIEKANLPKDSIGISGSLMLGLNNPSSDIDIIIYGTQTSIDFQEKLRRIYETTKICRKYNSSEYETHYNWRFGGSTISFQEFLRSEQRKLHQGKYNNIDFFIRYIKSPEDWKGSYEDYQFRDLGRISIKAEIIDASETIFTPCTYKIKCHKIIEDELKINKCNINKITEISSFRGRYCEHATDGEKVFVVGKLEEVHYKQDDLYYRIMLTDQKTDKMISLID